MREPIANAFDLIMDLMSEVQKHHELDATEFRRYMDGARELIPFISAERDGTLIIK